MLHKVKISSGGKISIPPIFKKYLHIKNGEEIFFELKDDQVTISSMKQSLEKARNILNKYHDSNNSLVDELIETRRAEAKNE